MSAALSDPVVAVAALVVIGYLAFVIAVIRSSILIERRCRELERQLRELAEEAREIIANDVSEIEAENAKLRILARSYVEAIEDCGCHHCPYYEDEDCPTETESMREGCRLRSELRELGVEVG